MKTRLGRTIGDDLAADLAWALLTDTLRVAARIEGVDLVVAHDPERASAGFLNRVRQALGGVAHRCEPQSEGDLGARLRHALRGAAGPRVVMGCDAPDLQPAWIQEALGHLQRGHVALGPTLDGGYYLLGLPSGVEPELLSAPIRWSTEHTLNDTERVIEDRGLRVVHLPRHQDVDVAVDLAALAHRLQPDAAPATYTWLSAHPGLNLPKPPHTRV